MMDKQSKYFYFLPMTEDDKVALKKEFKQYMSDVVFAFGLAGLSIIAFAMVFPDSFNTPTNLHCEKNK